MLTPNRLRSNVIPKAVGDFCHLYFLKRINTLSVEVPLSQMFCLPSTLRKHAYSNILKISPPKTKSFPKNSDIFHTSAQNIGCGYSLEPLRGGSNEYPQSMFLSRNKKNNVYPCKPQFYYIKVGFKGVNII